MVNKNANHAEAMRLTYRVALILVHARARTEIFSHKTLTACAQLDFKLLVVILWITQKVTASQECMDSAQEAKSTMTEDSALVRMIVPHSVEGPLVV